MEDIIWDEEEVIWDEPAAPALPQDIAPAPANKQRSVLGRTMDTLKQGLSDSMSTLGGDTYGRSGDPTQRDDLNPLSKAIKVAGGDVIPAVGEAGMDLAISAGKAVLSEAAEDAIASGVQSTVEAVTESAPGKAVAGGLKKWKAASPETYALAGELGNIGATVVPLPKIRPKFAKSNARVLKKSLAKDARHDLAARFEPSDPYQKGTLTIDDNLAQTKRFQPNNRYDDVLDEVDATRGVDVKNSHTQNREALETKITDINKNLDAKLEGVNVASRDMEDVILDAMAEVEGTSTLVGDAKTAANTLYDQFTDMTSQLIDDAGDISARDILKTRRQIDRMIEDGFGSDPFSPGYTGRKIAVARLRKAMNDIVGDAAPDAGVADDLSQMSKLLEARDVIIPKTRIEGDTNLGRFVGRLEETTGLRHPVSPNALLMNATNPAVFSATALGAGLLAGGRGISNAAKKASVAGDAVAADVITKGSGAAQRLMMIEALRSDAE
jgi:hypothetical protein